MKQLLALGFGLLLSAGGALAQSPDAAVWRLQGAGIAAAPAPLPQFIQQDLGRGGADRDRAPRGWRMNRDEDEDHDQPRSAGRAGAASGGPPEGHPGPHPSMMGGGMMSFGGARFHMRRGDSEIDVRCPADVRMSECVEAIGRMLDRLGAIGGGSGAPAPGAR